MNVIIKAGEDVVHSVALKDLLKVALGAAKQLVDEAGDIAVKEAPTLLPYIEVAQPVVDSFFDSWVGRVDHLLKNQEEKDPAVSAVSEIPVS